jgi:flagellar biosynthesis protein
MSNKERYLEAVGLGFDSHEEGPPSVTAIGELDLAAQMVALAKRYGIPVVEKPELCSSLASVPLDQEIPAELFEAAAAVLHEVGALSAKGATKRQSSS